MDVTKRQNGLYSTDSSGVKILFNSLDDAAFFAVTIQIPPEIRHFCVKK